MNKKQSDSVSDRKSYDPRCRELAEHFLQPLLHLAPERYREDVEELSQQIQDAVELFFVGSEDAEAVE